LKCSRQNIIFNTDIVKISSAEVPTTAIITAFTEVNFIKILQQLRPEKTKFQKPDSDEMCWRSLTYARTPICYYICPRRRGALSDNPIRPSVCPSLGYSTLAAWRSCLGYRHWLPAAGRPPETCGLRTRPRTDVDPPRVELPSAGGISSRRPER